jgi:hypothetical protein
MSHYDILQLTFRILPPLLTAWQAWRRRWKQTPVVVNITVIYRHDSDWDRVTCGSGRVLSAPTRQASRPPRHGRTPTHNRRLV